MIDNGKVSIIMPVYNSEKYIVDSIESVLKQTYSNWELLLVDDGSSDGSLEIIKKYAKVDQRIVVLQHDNNKGLPTARNTGIEKATGKYLAFLDSDDLWAEEKLEMQTSFMIKNDYGMTFTTYQRMDENGVVNGKVRVAIPKADYKTILWKHPMGILTVMIDMEKTGKPIFENWKKCEDYSLWLKLIKLTKYAFGLDELLAYYRVRNSSLSSNKLALVKYHWRIYRRQEKINVFKSTILIINTGLMRIFKTK